MKKVLLFVFAAGAWAQTVTPGSLELRNITHESAQVLFSTSGSWTNARVRIVQGTSGCEGGTAGTTYMNEDGAPSELVKGKYSVPFMLLQPNTTYSICPEITSDGTTWNGGVGISFKTDPMPAVHPVPPIAPKRFNTNYPDTTGFAQVTAASNDDCSSIRNALLTAISNSLTTGTVINIPAGSTCTGNIMPTAFPPDVVTLDSSAFNTSNHTIVKTNHGLTEGQQIVWNISYQNYWPYQSGNLPGSDQPIQTDSHPFNVGTPVYVHVIDANTFQVYANAAYSALGSCDSSHPLTARPCPQLWAFDTPGSGMIQYAPWPRAVKPIILQSSAVGDGTFVPEHVRVNPNWAPRMAKIQAPNSYLGGPHVQRFVFSTTCDTGNVVDCNNFWFTANIRFVGVEFTYQPLPQAAYTNDPPAGFALISTHPASSGIILDRCWVHGYPPPFRVYNILSWRGANQAIVDSYFSDMHFPRQFNNGLGVHP